MSKKHGASDDAVERADTIPPPPPAETKTPNAWRDELYPLSATGRPHPEGWKHSAAEQLHHWRKHEHHAQAAMLLTRADYEAALQAACDCPDGKYTPHKPALSPHAGRN